VVGFRQNEKEEDICDWHRPSMRGLVLLKSGRRGVAY
jgi:hypothetical protein